MINFDFKTDTFTNDKYDLKPIYLSYIGLKWDKDEKVENIKEYYTKDDIDQFAENIIANTFLNRETYKKLNEKVGTGIEEEWKSKNDEDGYYNGHEQEYFYNNCRKDVYNNIEEYPFESEQMQKFLNNLISADIYQEMTSLFYDIEIPDIFKDNDFNIISVEINEKIISREYWDSDRGDMSYSEMVTPYLRIKTDLDMLPYIKEDLTKFIAKYENTEENRQKLIKQYYEEIKQEKEKDISELLNDIKSGFIDNLTKNDFKVDYKRPEIWVSIPDEYAKKLDIIYNNDNSIGWNFHCIFNNDEISYEIVNNKKFKNNIDISHLLDEKNKQLIELIFNEPYKSDIDER